MSIDFTDMKCAAFTPGEGFEEDVHEETSHFGLQYKSSQSSPNGRVNAHVTQIY
jgi:hypothetical protein